MKSTVSVKLSEQILDSIRKFPDSIAFGYRDEVISYKELFARITKISQSIKARVADPGRKIGVFMEPGMEIIPTILGIMYSGNCFVPLDPVLPFERLSYMCSKSDIAIVFTQEALRADAVKHF